MCRVRAKLACVLLAGGVMVEQEDGDTLPFNDSPRNSTWGDNHRHNAGSNLWHPHPYDPDEKAAKAVVRLFYLVGWEVSTSSLAQCLQKSTKRAVNSLPAEVGKAHVKRKWWKTSFKEIQRLKTLMDFAIVGFCRVRPVHSFPVELQVKV